MLDNNFPRIAQAIEEMLDAYPRLRMSDAARKKTIAAFWRHLKKNAELQPVLDAIEDAPAKHPKSVPSVGELLALVDAKGRRGSTNGDWRQSVMEPESDEAVAARDLIPRHPSDQARYVAAAATEHERIARLWEVEDCNRGEHPYRDTPREIGVERIRTISALLGSVEQRSEEFKDTGGMTPSVHHQEEKTDAI